VNTPLTLIDIAERPVTGEEVSLQSAYVNQQRLHGNSHRRDAFDKWSWPGRRTRWSSLTERVSSFKCTAVTIDYMFFAIRILEPKWSTSPAEISIEVTPEEAGIHIEFTELQRFDGYAQMATMHFISGLMPIPLGNSFSSWRAGSRLRSDLDYTFEKERNHLPKISVP